MRQRPGGLWLSLGAPTWTGDLGHVEIASTDPGAVRPVRAIEPVPITWKWSHNFAALCDPDCVLDPLRRNPSAAALNWAANAFEPGARVVGYRRLIGGIISSVHRLSVIDARGAAHQLVLKRWVDEDREEATTMVEREAAVLSSLEGHALPTPRLVASSDGDEVDGYPSLLITRVPGRVFLTPTDPRDWLRQMAKALASVHSLPIQAPPYDGTLPHRGPTPPAWLSSDDLWREAQRLLSSKAPEGTAFLHGDYQHFNLLWAREKLSGVIDWTWARNGHPDQDVGHCRLNLAVLFSSDWADQFRDAYVAEAGRELDHWWNIRMICNYSDQWPKFIPAQVGNRATVDTRGMNARVERLLASELA